MKLEKRFLLFCFAASLACLGHIAAQAPKKAEQLNITKEAIVKDLDSYADGINKNHIDPYTFIKRQDFYSRVASLKDAAAGYNIDELLMKWQQVNALLHDGHTTIQSTAKEFFPFTCHWYKEGIFIIANNDENSKFYHGKITAVNGMPIAEVAKLIATIIPDTNTAELKRLVPYYISDPIILHGLGITAEKGKVAYTVISPGGETLKMEPSLIDRIDMNLVTGYKKDHFLRSSVKGKYWFKYFDSSRTIYFQYGSCTDDGTFGHVTDELEKAIEEKAPKKIIIDIRYNGGGNSNLLKPFIDYLSKSSLNKKGRIYVLIGRKTYSSAVLTALSLKRQTNSIFLGEATSCNIDHFGEAKYFILPETRLKVSYSTRFFSSYEKYTGCFKPDVTIEETFAEYDKDIDSVIDYAMEQ